MAAFPSESLAAFIGMRSKPTQNAFIESFNGRFRDECLNENWFLDLDDAREIIEAWRIDYNTSRPHSALAYATPGDADAEHRALDLPGSASSLHWSPVGTRLALALAPTSLP